MNRPITRKEQYLAKAAGVTSGDTPPAVTKEEQYLKKIADNITGLTENPLPEVSSEDEGKVPVVGSDGKWELGTPSGGGDYLVVKVTGTGVYDGENNQYTYQCDTDTDTLQAALTGLKPIFVAFPLLSMESPYYVSYEDAGYQTMKLAGLGFAGDIPCLASADDSGQENWHWAFRINYGAEPTLYFSCYYTTPK